MSDPRTELTLEIEEWERQARETLTASGMTDQDIERARDGWDEGFIDDDPDAAHQARTAALDLLETVGELRAELRRGGAAPERFALLGMEFQGAVVSMLYPETSKGVRSRMGRKGVGSREWPEDSLRAVLRMVTKEIGSTSRRRVLKHIEEWTKPGASQDKRLPIQIDDVDHGKEKVLFFDLRKETNRTVSFARIGNILSEIAQEHRINLP